MYYCPRCDRSIAKERIEQADRELREKYGVDKLSGLRCPVCDCEFIDMDKVSKGGEAHVGKSHKKANTP